MGTKHRRTRDYLTITTDVEIDVSDIIEELTDDDLIDELKGRGLIPGENSSITDLVELICEKQTLNDAERIRDFFKKYDLIK